MGPIYVHHAELLQTGPIMVQKELSILLLCLELKLFAWRLGDCDQKVKRRPLGVAPAGTVWHSKRFSIATH